MRSHAGCASVACTSGCLDRLSFRWEEGNADTQKFAESNRCWFSSRSGRTRALVESGTRAGSAENVRLGARLVAWWVVLEARGGSTPCQGQYCLHAKLHGYGGPSTPAKQRYH